MTEECQRCKDVDDDRRTLKMSCGYEMSELEIPLLVEPITHEDRSVEKFYTMRVCKNCRADWMQAIKNWFHEPMQSESCGSGIFIRQYGANVEVTEEVFRKLYPNKTPVRCTYE